MNHIDANRLLMEMRSLALQAERPPDAAQVSAAAETPRFGDAVKSALSQVNAMQQNAQSMVTAFEAGQPGTDLTRVMLEVQKAGLAFRAMTEVRNKLVNAYQEIMNMPV